MKKIITIAMALILVLGLSVSFTGCGGDKKSDTTKVGFIYIGSAKDGGFSQAQDEGREAMVKHFDGKVETEVIEEVSDTDAQATRDAALSLMDKGCTVIVGTSFGYMDVLDEMAKEYPDIYFLHFSGYKSNDTNFDNYFGAMEEPRYLTGVVAGSMTKSNTLGYVAAFDLPEVNIGINAFTLGAQSVNPNVTVKVVYLNTWYDPAKEKQAAEALLSQGCDVLTQHCDTTGPILAAEAAGAYAIGYNLDKQDIAPDTFLTAPIWHHEVFYNEAIQSIMDGKFKPQSYYGTMKDGYVDIAPMSDKVPKDVQDKVNKVKDSIIAGDFAPFSGKIEYADGTLLCKEGQTLTREEIWKTKGVIKGVSATEQK